MIHRKSHAGARLFFCEGTLPTGGFARALLSACAPLAALLLCGPVLAYEVYVAPAFVYNEGYFNPPTPMEPSVAQAWVDVQNDTTYNYCSTVGGGTTCYSLLNLHVDNSTGLSIVYNNTVNYLTWFDQKICQTPTGGQQTCNTNSDWNPIQAGAVCPPGFAEGIQTGTDSNPRHDTVWCQAAFPDTQPPPKGCKSCIGNPIYAATGLKVQAETDYAGTTGLSFVRSYRSDVGFWSSIASSAFVDYSQPNATQTNNCYQSYYVNSSTQAQVPTCFQYISTALASYQLATSDGRYIQFSGPNGAVTQNADVNDRVTQINVGGVLEWQVQRDDDSTEIYSAAGSLLQRTERGGRTFTFTYSTSSTPGNIAPRPGLLLSEGDAFRHTLSWQYNSAAQIVKMLDPAGGVYQYTYDPTGNLSTVTYPDTSVKTYSYNETADTGGTNLPNALTGITDESIVRFATYHYDSQGRGTSSEHAGGVDKYSLSYQGTSPGATATVTDPLLTSRTYQFQAELSYLQDSNQAQPAASGSSTVNQTEGFDANGNVNTLTDYKGNVTKYTFDLSRNLETQRTEAYGTPRARTISTQWWPTYRVPQVITEPNRTTSFNYDGSGNLLTKTITDTSVTPNVARTWTYAYDSYGRMLTAKGPRTDVDTTTHFAYYTCTTGSQCGQLQTVTDALGHVTTYNTYNAHGQPLTITDPNGVVTTLTYDGRLRLTSRQVGTETTGFSYWPTGLLKQVTLPDSSYVTYTYDAAHRLTQITDEAGNAIKYTLDAMGNRTAENGYDPSNVLHRTHTRTINALNKVYQEINAAGTAAVTTTFAYDDDGNQTSIQAPLSRNTANSYDELNRMTQMNDAGNGVTKFGYDANDNLTSVQDPRNFTTGYTPNGFGDVIQLTSPDTGTTHYTYDSGGNLYTSTDARGAGSTSTYDALNRPTVVAYALNGVTDQTISYTYDVGGGYGKGRLTGASDANHSLAYTYDALGRVVSKTQTMGTIALTVGYTYANGDLTTVTTPSGKAITYGFNSDHQVVSVTVGSITVLSNATYEPFGSVNGWTWGNGTTTVRAYNTDGNVSTISSAASKTYGYDNATRISGITDNGNSALSWTYGYDALDHVSSASTSSQSITFTYDANGNRLTQGGTLSATFTPATTSNQLNSVSGGLTRTYSYTASGNTAGYAGIGFTYNARERVISATTSGTTVGTYVYNALGQRIQKATANGTTYFAYDEAGHLVGEYDVKGAMIQEIAWLGDTPVATIRNEACGLSIFYIHTDHLNTPRRITRRSTTDVVWSWESDPFGNTGPNENPSGLGTFSFNLRFPGQYFDTETGLNQNYARDYDPAVGRYVESDPIGLTGGINTYAYTKNAPMMRIDPSGLFALDTSFSWYTVPKIGSGWWIPFFTKVRLGYTDPHLSSARCTCKNCGGAWSLVGCSASLDVNIFIRNDLNVGADAFARRGEGEHVSDLMSGMGSLYRAGAAAEATERGLPYSNQEICESAASNAVNAALRSAMKAIIDNSRLRDTSGSHTYPGPWPFN
jgi:RHS repeat-associated protein